jgi:hypothetical protein
VQNKCDAILSFFLMVGVILLWYCWNSFSFMMVFLFGSVISSSVVMLSSSSWCRYCLFRFGVMCYWFVCVLGCCVLEGIMFLLLGSVDMLLFLVGEIVGLYHILPICGW